MSWRDLVNNTECGDVNPLTQARGLFEKTPQQYDQWERGDLHQEESRLQRDRDDDLDDEDIEAEMERRMDHPLGQQHRAPPSFEIEEYERELRMDMPPPRSEQDSMLSTILKAFVSGRGRLQDFPDLGLSSGDKAKIRDRAGIMARHMFDNESQGFAEEQIHNLMNSLQIGRQPTEAELDNVWNQGATITQTRRGEEWAKEYPGFNATSEIDDYDEILRNTSENKRMAKVWMEENLQRASPNRWIQEYNRGDGARWANEYSTKSERQIEEETMESAWEDAAHDRLMEAAWGEGTREMNRTRGTARNLTELTSAITQIDDPKLQASNFMQFMQKINKGQVSFGDNRVIEHELPPMMDNGLVNDDWLREYDETLNEFEDEDYPDPREWAREYQDFSGAIAADRLAEYEFVVNHAMNPYSTHEDPYAAGVDLFNKGMITEAILALEMEVQRNPTNSAAWQTLGQAHAENDKDNLAILSLEKAVQVDPQNLDALAALAVSYTNDFSRDKALDALETWLTLNNEYTHIPPAHRESHQPHDGVPDFYTEAWSRHSRVVDMYIEAAQLRPDNPDPEVQTALGLLYNLSYEYDKAVDCFKAALTKRPSDYRLWNKLGATLANSNRGEEALGAYFKALEGKPTYVRARANLGISFLALNSYNEAAQSFLSALRLHPNAAHLWDNLKMVFRLMGRDDLEERAASNDVEAFPENFSL